MDIGAILEIIGQVPNALPVIITVVLLVEFVSQAFDWDGRQVVVLALSLGFLFGGGAKLVSLEQALGDGETLMFTFTTAFEVATFGLMSGVLAVGADMWVDKQFSVKSLPVKVITGGPGGNIDTLPVASNPLDPSAMSHPSQRG